MGFQWIAANAEECNAFGQASGQRSVTLNGVPWLRIRPFFYRPLLPFQAFAPGSSPPPPGALLGAFQHAVPSAQGSNSSLNLLIFQDAHHYAASALDYNRRRQIKLSSKAFEVRTITSPAEFKEKAYPVYLSFLERTKYEHASHRRDASQFGRWADCLFKMPKVAILGAFGAGTDTLGAVSLSFLFQETVVYASFFCDTALLKQHISDCMLHFVREAAAAQDVKRVFVGMRKVGSHASVDEFYLTRGCKVVSQPAFLHVNPFARAFLIACMPKQYERMYGRAGGKDAAAGGDGDHPTPDAIGTAEGKPQAANRFGGVV